MPPMPSQPLYSPVPEKVAYRPFGAVHQVTDMPPPTGVNSVGLQQDPQQEHKKHKFGKFGNTVSFVVLRMAQRLNVMISRWPNLLLEV